MSHSRSLPVVSSDDAGPRDGRRRQLLLKLARISRADRQFGASVKARGDQRRRLLRRRHNGPAVVNLKTPNNIQGCQLAGWLAAGRRVKMSSKSCFPLHRSRLLERARLVSTPLSCCPFSAGCAPSLRPCGPTPAGSAIRFGSIRINCSIDLASRAHACHNVIHSRATGSATQAAATLICPRAHQHHDMMTTDARTDGPSPAVCCIDRRRQELGRANLMRALVLAAMLRTYSGRRPAGRPILGSSQNHKEQIRGDMVAALGPCGHFHDHDWQPERTIVAPALRMLLAATRARADREGGTPWSPASWPAQRGAGRKVKERNTIGSRRRAKRAAHAQTPAARVCDLFLLHVRFDLA
jgi:hypothetical protein